MLITDIIYFQTELTMRPVIIRLTDSEILKHRKCPTEKGYGGYKVTIFDWLASERRAGIKLLVSPSILKDTYDSAIILIKPLWVLWHTIIGQVLLFASQCH